MTKVICGAILVASLGVNILNADLLPAKKLKSISAKATSKAIMDFKKSKKTKAAYDETKKFVADRLNKVANEGFYNIVYIQLDDYGKMKNMKYNGLSSKQKDMLKSILKKELRSLGYTVESAKYDNIMLHWAVSWK